MANFKGNRRSSHAIVQDYVKILNYASNCTSITELCKKTGMTRSKLFTTLSKKGKVDLIQTMLKSNNQHKTKSLSTPSTKSQQRTFYVIDASICGTPLFSPTISSILNMRNSRVVLTDVTITELDKLKSGNDVSARDAREILRIALDYDSKFNLVLTPNSNLSPDNKIVNYCKENKNNCILVSADNAMLLTAKVNGIQILRVQHSLNGFSQNSRTYEFVDGKKTETLDGAFIQNGKLFIHASSNNERLLLVNSNGIELRDQLVELNIGDEIYIVSHSCFENKNFCTLKHFRIVSITPNRNCIFISGKRYYDHHEVYETNAFYKSLVREFRKFYVS